MKRRAREMAEAATRAALEAEERRANADRTAALQDALERRGEKLGG